MCREHPPLKPEKAKTDNVVGNRIVDMGKMEELVNLKLEQKIGFGCKEALRCTTCGYKTTPAELVQRADTRRPGARGPLAVKLNIQTVTPGAKDRYGPSAIKPLFASLNITDTWHTTLHKKQNVACKAYEELNLRTTPGVNRKETGVVEIDHDVHHTRETRGVGMDASPGVSQSPLP
ncbi:hypothetical protein Bbelb_334670 [Branchiostoma belcheri]|nr:hypothetical protein Bbelb_334670 [Branchiostoma belcheri]